MVTVPVKTGDAKPAAGDSTFDVSVEGGQYVILAACDKDGAWGAARRGEREVWKRLGGG